MAYIGNPPAERFTSFDYQDLTGGTGTSFTLTHPVGNAQEILVMVNNVVQEPGVAYTVSGTGLTMTGSIVAADDFYVVYRGKAIQTATHPSDRALTATDGTFTGDLTVDTNTLVVDAANNRIGVNVASPAKTLDLNAGAVGNIATFTDGVATNFTFKTNSSNVGTFGTEAGSTHLAFMASGSEKGRFLSGGGLTFNGDTAAANALDDYEEGTFDCSIHDGTTTPTQTQKGYYVKIGKMVHIHGQTIISGSSSGGSFLRITLPFQVVSDSRGGIAHGVNQPISLATSGEYLGLISEINTSILYIVSHAFGGGHTHQNFNQLGTGLFSFGGTYRSD